MFGVDVALGDRHEAGEASFRREKVVVARIQLCVADAEPDREQLADGIEQEVELHLPGESLGKVGDRLEASNEYGRRTWFLAGTAHRWIGCFGDCREDIAPVLRRLEKRDVTKVAVYGSIALLRPRSPVRWQGDQQVRH